MKNTPIDCHFSRSIHDLHTLTAAEMAENLNPEGLFCTVVSYYLSNSRSLSDADERLVQLPLSKIKNLMKLDAGGGIVSADAAFAVAKATELFIESLAKQSYNEMVSTKKKTVQKRDVDKVLQSTDALLFLEDCMNVFDIESQGK